MKPGDMVIVCDQMRQLYARDGVLSLLRPGQLSLLRPGQLGFVVGHKPKFLLVLSPGGIEWMWRTLLRRADL